MSEIESLLRLRGVDDPEEKMKYLRILQAMDRVELHHAYEKSKANHK